MLPRQLYFPSPKVSGAIWLNAGYTEAVGLKRAELITISLEDDAYVDWTRRESLDNGRTWGAEKVIDGAVLDTPRGGVVAYPALPFFDPLTKRSYRFTMRRIWPGQKPYTYDFNTGNHHFTNHCFVSENGGPDQLLRFEQGGEYDASNPFEPSFADHNASYFGTHPAFGKNGEVYYPLTCYGKSYRERRGVCIMRRDPKTGAWSASNLENIPWDKSIVGLEEPAAVCLKDGRVMVVSRGHATQTTPGVKWMTMSTDGGRTISPHEELRYDDGSLVYSPCSIHKFMRSTKNGKLYWFANILDKPPEGQSPRYPLCVAEIDETKAAVIKDSVQILDDRREGEPAALQLSNFSMMENRETLDIEIYMTLLGLNAKDFWYADVYRYAWSPK